MLLLQMGAVTSLINSMSHKYVNTFDFNLVKVFLAIWDLRSLTAAGDRLGLTQPAVIHALRRLRDQFSNPLFTRSGNEMAPTDAAMRLHPPFERAMQIVSQSVQHNADFIPQTSTRTFRLGMSDISEFCYLPDLLARIEALAPSVRVESVEVDLETIDSRMRSGQVDIALGYLPELRDCLDRFLSYDTFVCLLRKDHSLGGDALSLHDHSKLTCVDSPHATGYRLIDQQLHLLGVQSKMSARLAHFTVVPEIIRRTNMATLYPRLASELLNADGRFRILRLPLDLPKIPVHLHVRRNFTGNRGIRWLSKIIALAATKGNLAAS